MKTVIWILVIATLAVIITAAIWNARQPTTPQQNTAAKPTHPADIETRELFLKSKAADITQFQFDLPGNKSFFITDLARIEMYRKSLTKAVQPVDPKYGAPGGLVATANATFKNGKTWSAPFGFGRWWWAFSKDFRNLYNEDARRRNLNDVINF
jgi:hypothetical protein